MHFIAVRGAVAVGHGSIIETNSIHDQCVALIMTDGFAIPGRRYILGVLLIHKNTTNLMITLMHNQNDVFALDDMKRAHQRMIIGNARRHA